MARRPMTAIATRREYRYRRESNRQHARTLAFASHAGLDRLMPATARPAAPAESWIVLKFGGTSVSTRARWANIAEIASTRRQVR